MAADPTTVSCVVTDPSGIVTVHTYQGAAPADITKPLVGKYNLVVPCSPGLAGIDGLWSYVWIGTGAVSDVQPGTWRVLPPTIGNWYIGLEEFKDRLGITDSADDSQAQIAIQSVSNWINVYCGRHFYRGILGVAQRHGRGPVPGRRSRGRPMIDVTQADFTPVTVWARQRSTVTTTITAPVTAKVIVANSAASISGTS